MSATASKTERDRVARLWQCRRGDVDHVRIGASRFDKSGITLLGTAAELHGPDGVCTCCPRRKK